MKSTKNKKKKKEVNSPLSTKFEAYFSNPRVVILAGTLLFLIAALWHFQPRLSTIGDNAQFLVLAEGLATGKGFVHANFPGEVPSTKFPFGYPAILAIFYFLFDYRTFLVYKILSLLFTAGAVYLVLWLFLREHQWIYKYAAVLIALNLHLIEYSSLILSEAPYLFFSILGIYLFSRWEERPKVRRMIFALLALGAAYYVRTIGIAFAGALFLYFLFRRDWKNLLLWTGFFILLTVPWNLWTQAHGGGSYLHQFMAKNPYSPHLGTIGFTDLIERLTTNAKGYFLRLIPDLYIPGYARYVHKIGDMQVFLLAVLVSFPWWWGFIHRLIRKRALVDFYVLGYLGIIVLWPQVWMSERFLIGVVPFILFYFFWGFVDLARRIRLKEEGQELATQTVLVILLIPTIIGFLKFENPQTKYTPDWQNYFQAAAWIKSNTPPETIVACRKPYLFYILSGRKTTKYKRSIVPEEILEDLEKQKVDYLIFDNFFWSQTTQRYVGPVIKKYPEKFVVVQRFENPPTFILALNFTANQNRQEEHHGQNEQESQKKEN